MADLVLETLESHSDAAATLIAKLPGRRVDAYIRKVASAGKPKLGELEGGYNEDYAHFSNLPLFHLYSSKAEARMQQKWDMYMPPGHENFGPPKLSLKEQAADAYISLFGLGLKTYITWLGRGLVSLGTTAAKATCEQVILARFTRWTIPAAFATDLDKKVPTFVDVFEYQWTDPNSKRAKLAKKSGNSIAIKVGSEGDKKVTVRVLNFEAKTFSGQKGWSTRANVKELCETLVLVENGLDVPMEVVARIQRMCSPTEINELWKEYEKRWQVPKLLS